MDYKLISTYLDFCKTHKRLSSHTIRAYKNDLIIPFLKEIGLNHVKYANPYLHGLGKSYIMKGQLIKGVYHEGQ